MTRNSISARDLRQILFLIDDQDMSIAELRAELFEIVDQDREYQIGVELATMLNEGEAVR